MKTGRIIAELRTKAGMSQSQLAEKLYVSRELVSKWETEKSRPDRSAVRAMAELFGVEPESMTDADGILSRELSSAVPAGYGREPDLFIRDLNRFLSTLSERDRSVFIRRYRFCEDAREIGEKYGISESYVRTLLSRSRKKLRKFLKEETA